MVNSFGYTYPIRLLRSRPYDEDDLIDGVTMEDLRQYNDARLEQEIIEEFNRQQKLFEDVENNCHKLFLQVTNSGNSPGSSIYVTLFFPPELLVYSESDCADVNQPKALDMPGDPVEKALNIEYHNQWEGVSQRPGRRT